MEKNARCFELRTTDGGPLFSFLLVEKEVVSEKPALTDHQEKTLGKGNGSGPNEDAKMTDAQKRFLFRLLADNKKIEGDDAKKFLLDIFRVDSLKDVSKSEASKVIEQLLGESNGGTKNGSSLQ